MMEMVTMDKFWNRDRCVKLKELGGGEVVGMHCGQMPRTS